jgi:hypothetical protein
MRARPFSWAFRSIRGRRDQFGTSIAHDRRQIHNCAVQVVHVDDVGAEPGNFAHAAGERNANA